MAVELTTAVAVALVKLADAAVVLKARLVKLADAVIVLKVLVKLANAVPVTLADAVVVLKVLVKLTNAVVLATVTVPELVALAPVVVEFDTGATQSTSPTSILVQFASTLGLSVRRSLRVMFAWVAIEAQSSPS